MQPRQCVLISLKALTCPRRAGIGQVAISQIAEYFKPKLLRLLCQSKSWAHTNTHGHMEMLAISLSTAKKIVDNGQWHWWPVKPSSFGLACWAGSDKANVKLIWYLTYTWTPFRPPVSASFNNATDAALLATSKGWRCQKGHCMHALMEAGHLAVNFIYVFNRLCSAIALAPRQHTHTFTQPILVRFLTAKIEFSFGFAFAF